MNTRKLKFLIPVMAIGLAITASAFTSMEKSHVGENSLIVGYVYDLVVREYEIFIIFLKNFFKFLLAKI